jgi:hypothetical protein
MTSSFSMTNDDDHFAAAGLVAGAEVNSSMGRPQISCSGGPARFIRVLGLRRG